MFSLYKHTSIRPIKPSEEKDLIARLSENPEENVYLLGLLADYSLQGLVRMGWARFYTPRGDSKRSVFYRDATGLVVLSGASDETISMFARFCVSEGIAVTRIIANEILAKQLHQHLRQFDHGSYGEEARRFPESALVLYPSRLTEDSQPELIHATQKDVDQITRGSLRAMREELEVEISERDFQRVYRSKMELVRNHRYFVLKERDRIVFQAYLSAFLPTVSQIQGVWVPPECRGKGIAARCIGEICRRSLEKSERIVLRVQKRNLAANRVYRKVGFVPFMDFLSLWYKDRLFALRTD